MVKHLFTAIFYFFMSISFWSCNDLYTSEDEEKVQYSQFSTCEMDSESLSKILSKDINSELVCLEHNLNLFIDIVETKKPGYLQLDALKTYIENNMEDISSSTIEIISAIFEVNSLIFGAEQNFISKANLQKIIHAAKDLNKLVVENNIYEYFTSDEIMPFEEHNKRKGIIFSTFGKIGKIIEKLIVTNHKSIKISEFLNKFSNIDNNTILKNIDELLFVKKAVLGGKVETISSFELKLLSKNLNTFGKIVYDFINLPDTFPTSATEEYEIMQILNEDIQSTQDLFFYSDNPNVSIVDFDQLSRVVKIFFPEISSYLVYKKSILKIKEIFLGNSKETFTSGDISKLLDEVILENLNQGVFYFRTYIMNSSLMEEPDKIWARYFNFFTLNEEEETYKERFVDIVRNYKFLHGGEFSPTFSSDYERPARGIFYVSVFENIVKQFMKYYSTEEQTQNGKPYITQKQLTSLMVDFSEIFIGEGYILPGRVANTAETITLMTSLFHMQSNGDSKIELPEFVEFINTMRASLHLADEMYLFLQDRCEVDDQKRVTPSCYREYFLDFMENMVVKSGRQIKSYLPDLSNYLGSIADQGLLDKYLTSTAKFSRACSVFTDGTEVPMKKGDFIVSWGGLLAIEQSIIKFDKNKNSILDTDEVDDAFVVYKAAVEGLLPLDSLKVLSKDFFRYLIKYEKVPEIPEIDSLSSIWKAIKETAHFGRFLLKSSRDKKEPADRMTFAAVLEIIAVNSPTNKAHPYPCDTLK